MSISQNIYHIQNNIDRALKVRKVAGISTNVKLVAVTKNHPVSQIQTAIDLGVTAIGENRIQEALSKYPILNRHPEWHLIGHLQTNKVRQAIEYFDLIHSVDSEKLAIDLNKAAAKAKKVQQILIQINVAGEESKFGIHPTALSNLTRTISQLENIRLCGLMTIAPYSDDPELTRPIFKTMYELFQELASFKLPNADLKWLSMGMSSDYPIAIEEGANLIRIGSGIFGPRQYNKEV